MPPEITKSAPLNVHYPNTGLGPFEQLAPAELKQSHPVRKEFAFWTEPASLLILLDELGKVKDSSSWAAETTQLVNELGAAVEHGSDKAASILDRLAKLMPKRPAWPIPVWTGRLRENCVKPRMQSNGGLRYGEKSYGSAFHRWLKWTDPRSILGGYRCAWPKWISLC